MDRPKDPSTRKRKVQSSTMSARNQGTSSRNVMTLKSQRIRRRNSLSPKGSLYIQSNSRNKR